MTIHETAYVSKEAEIHPEAYVGPFCVIKGQVKIGKGTRLENHVTVGSDSGRVTIGENNKIWPGAVVGAEPQDLSYKGEVTRLEIGNGNQIREFVTINIGTQKDQGVTRIADNNMLMAYVHIAHDCQLKNRIVIANSTHFAGHVTVEDDVRIGGGVLIAQFVTLGRHCYIAGDSAINKDVLPFSMAEGTFAVCRATNKVGLERAGVSKEVIQNVHKAIRFLIKGERTVDEALNKIDEDCESFDEVRELYNFVKNSEKGVAR